MSSRVRTLIIIMLLINIDSLILTFCNYRYAVYELEYPADAGRIESKILFILYAPDICDTREKFLYATTKDALRKKVQPFNKEF